MEAKTFNLILEGDPGSGKDTFIKTIRRLLTEHKIDFEIIRFMNEDHKFRVINRLAILDIER